MPKDPDLEILSWSEDTLAQVVQLYDRVWPSGAAEHERKSRWAFAGNSLGRAPLVVARDATSGRVLAVRGGIVWPLDGTGGARVIQLHGTAVDESVRRRGLFTQMTRMFLECAAAGGTDLIFNVSVDASRAGYEQLGWGYRDDFKRLVLPLRPVRLLRHLARAAPRAGRDRIAESERPAFEEMGELVAARERVMDGVVHSNYGDSNLFEWRFSDPGYKWFGDAKRGVAVYRMRKRGNLRELLLGDVWPGEHSLRRLIAGLAWHERPDLIVAWMSSSHPLFRQALHSGLLVQPGHSLNLGVRWLHPREPCRWGLSASDIDTF